MFHYLAVEYLLILIIHRYSVHDEILLGECFENGFQDRFIFLGTFTPTRTNHKKVVPIDRIVGSERLQKPHLRILSLNRRAARSERVIGLHSFGEPNVIEGASI